MPKISHAGYNDYITKSPVWRRKRKAILNKRGKRCEICKSVTSMPHIHHLHYANLGNEANQDLQVACVICHNKEHSLRPIWSFEDQASLTRYIDTLEPEESSRRFPRFWIETEKYIAPIKTSSKPAIAQPSIKISSDGMTFIAAPRPRVAPDRFQCIVAAGFRCQDCAKAIRVDTFHLINDRAVCGCLMAAEYAKRN